MKPYFVLLIGLPDVDLEHTQIDVEKVLTLQEAKILIKTRFFDAVVVNDVLPDAPGHDITIVYPHYRTILISNKTEVELKNSRNGVHKLLSIPSVDAILENVFEIISTYSNKHEDSLMVLLSIQDSIEELKTSSNFTKSSLKEVHLRLEKLEQNQNILKNKFGKFSEQRIKAEQFFIDTVTVLRSDVTDLTEIVNGSIRDAETDRRSVEKAG